MNIYVSTEQQCWTVDSDSEGAESFSTTVTDMVKDS